MIPIANLLLRSRTKKTQRECRQIAERRLDDDNTKRELSNYRGATKSKDYQGTWQRRLDEILAVIESGETTLSRVLAQVARKSEQTRNMDLGRGSYLAFDKLVELPSRGAQRLHRGAVVEAVADLVSDATESVVGLGSGRGEHRCNVWLEGGARSAQYYACGIAESGRVCALVLAALEPALRMKAPYFNYTKPSFATLPSGQRELVAYSVQSIEQVREVPMELITGLCALAQDVKVAHFEPIGWQMIEESQRNEVTRRHHARCLEKSYNTNFWALLKQAEAEQRIEIKVAIPNFFGLEHNPTSYIVWQNRAPR